MNTYQNNLKSVTFNYRESGCCEKIKNAKNVDESFDFESVITVGRDFIYIDSEDMPWAD